MSTIGIENDRIHARLLCCVGKLGTILRREAFSKFESLLGWAHGRANLAYGCLQEIANEELYDMVTM